MLTASTPIIDVTGATEVVHRGKVPPRSVVIPGSRPKKFPAGEYQLPCALIIGQRNAATDQKTSLNQGDSFIVFANPSTVWVWHGSSANPDERAKCNSTAETMCTEGTVQVLESGADDDETFWGYLENDGDIADADDDDEAIEQFTPLLFQLQAAGEPVQVAEGEPVSSKFRFGGGGGANAKISRSELKDQDVFLLDVGWDLFVWIGPASDRSEKVGAIGWADQYCRASPRTADLPLTLVKAGYESSSFNEYFSD